MTEIVVPNLGGISESKVIDILVKKGQKVKKDMPLITLESDKASMDVPSPYSGTVSEINVKEGDSISQGDVILTLTGVSKVIEKKAKKLIKKPISSEKNTDISASPLVRRLAFEMDIDLSDIPATGKGHRVTFDDMKGYLSKGKPKAIDYSQWGEVFYSALSPIQKISSQVLTEACATVPQVTQHHWVDITALEIARKGMREKITLLAFIIKAMVEVMAKHPSFQRAWVDNKEYVNRRYYHIGIAVDTKGGLIVPVIKDVDKKDILVLAKEIILLSEKARKGNLKQDELSGRCASISSLGGIGGGHFTPIVTPPDAYMVGVARAVYQPIYVGDAVEKRYMLPLSLSYDHRLIDGANAARFLMDLETYLVNMTNLVQDE